MQTFAILSVVFWLAVVGGAVALVVAVASPQQRVASLWVAAGLWVVPEILGIMSIGILFLVAAVACGVGAVMVRRGRHGGTHMDLVES